MSKARAAESQARRPTSPEGLGAGSQPEVGRAAAEECFDEIADHLSKRIMCFVTAAWGGGTPVRGLLPSWHSRTRA